MLRILWRSLLLLALSGLILAGMAVYVKLTQHKPDPAAPLEASVNADFIWPWQQTELLLRYSGEPGRAVIAPPPQPTDLVFLLDSSGSMKDEDLAKAKQALVEFARNVAPAGQRNRIAVVEFASQSRAISPFTTDYAALQKSVTDMARGSGGGTQFLAGLRQALALLQGQRPGTVVMLTDGGAGESLDELRRFYEQEWRPQGHELFLLGIGADAVNPASFLELTDDPDRYILTTLDRNAIGALFEAAAAHLGNVLGRDAELRIPLAEPLWDWSPAGVAPTADASGPAQPDQLQATPQLLPYRTEIPATHNLPVLFQRPYLWIAPIEPRFGGILTTLAEPVTLSYIEADGQRRSLSTPGQAPKVLAVTPWLLALLLLPALLYLLAALMEWLLRPRGVISELSPGTPGPVYRPPPTLPLRPIADAQRIHWTPSLVLGLGRTGRHVLTHIQQVFADSLDEPATRPVLLALDVARAEVEPQLERVPGCLAPLRREQIFLLPPASCDLNEAIHQQWSPDEPAAALDLRPYQHLGTDALSLRNGTDGQAPLARLALLRDLAAGADSALLRRLHQGLDAWWALNPAQQYRQILLVANVHGGVGSGWLSDLLILLRRLVTVDEQQGKAVEIAVLLLGDEVSHRRVFVPLKAPTLFAELDRLASAGRQRFRHCLSTNPGTARPWLDGWVERRPQDALFVLPGVKTDWETRLYPTAADTACLLLEPRWRHEFNQLLQGIQAVETNLRAHEGRERYTQISIHNAVFPRSYFHSLLASRLGIWLITRAALFPGLELSGEQLRLREPPVVPATLLDRPLSAGGQEAPALPDSSDRAAVDALREAALGDPSAFQALIAVATVDESRQQHAIHAWRLLLLANANRLLVQERELGLIGLYQAAHSYAQHLQPLAQPLAQALAADCKALAEQAAHWIDLLLGADVLRNLAGQTATATGGLLGAYTAGLARDLRTLDEWRQADSRVLVGPVGPLPGIDLNNTALCAQRLDALLQDEFLPAWLGPAAEPLTQLAARCHWELTLPGPQGDAFGIQLVLRDTQVRRYLPTPADLERFTADLRQEVASVLDADSRFHLFTLLQRCLAPASAATLDGLIQQLRGNLRGERSNLLLALPVLPHASDSAVWQLRRQLDAAFQTQAGAAELVYSYASHDRYRLSVLQILPLLTTAQQQAPQPALHGYERLRQDYAERLARWRNLTTVRLPPAAGIALQDEARLRQFARLYKGGKVKRRPGDTLWQLWDGSRWQLLSSVPEQTLADAAAAFVTQALVAPLDMDIEDTPWPEDEIDDFTTLLDYLLYGPVGSSAT